jgi:hypothetical protein
VQSGARCLDRRLLRLFAFSMDWCWRCRRSGVQLQRLCASARTLVYCHLSHEAFMLSGIGQASQSDLYSFNPSHVICYVQRVTELHILNSRFASTRSPGSRLDSISSTFKTYISRSHILSCGLRSSRLRVDHDIIAVIRHCEPSLLSSRVQEDGICGL